MFKHSSLPSVNVFWSFTFLFLLSLTSLSSNAIQFFHPATYLNPAAMVEIKTNNLKAGFIAPNIYNKFEGKVLGVKGSVTTDNTPLLPYVLLTHRISEKFVAGLNLSYPVLSYINWPADGFQQVLGITTIVKAYEIAPKLSYSFTSKFSVGAAFRYLDFFNTQINYSVAGSYLANNCGGVGFGGSVGFWYMFNPNNFLDFSYYTPIKSTLKGSSASFRFRNPNFEIGSFTYAPGTFVLNLKHIFTKKFVAAVKVAYSCWSPDKEIVLKNVAIGPNPTILPSKWSDTVFASLFGRYQTSPKFAISGLFGFDQSLVEASNNSISLPISNLFFAGLGGEYRFAPTGWFSLFVGQARGYNPDTRNPSNSVPGPADGKNRAIYTWVDMNSSVYF